MSEQQSKLTRHRAKQKAAGVVRFSVQLGGDTVRTLRTRCREHGKTQREFLELGIMAADAMLAGRLQVAAGPKKISTPPVIIRKGPTNAPREFAHTDTPSTPEKPLQDAQCKPTDDADARIAAAASAFRVEP